MLNPVTFTFEGESGPLSVTVSGSDYAAYEDAFDRVLVHDLVAGRYKCQCYVIWHALTRDGHTKLTFDEFLATSPQFAVTKNAEDSVPPLERKPPTGS